MRRCCLCLLRHFSQKTTAEDHTGSQLLALTKNFDRNVIRGHGRPDCFYRNLACSIFHKQGLTWTSRMAYAPNMNKAAGNIGEVGLQQIAYSHHRAVSPALGSDFQDLEIFYVWHQQQAGGLLSICGESGGADASGPDPALQQDPRSCNVVICDFDSHSPGAGA